MYLIASSILFISIIEATGPKVSLQTNSEFGLTLFTMVGEKIAPYLLPMKENLKFFLGRGYYGHYENEGLIQYKPLEIMRGSTFHNTYMILDEAQNCTTDQIKMFITRMGKDSKVLINGDVNQDDLRGRSGLDFCIGKLKGIDGVGVCELTYEDIQRNDIIGKVLTALEN